VFSTAAAVIQPKLKAEVNKSSTYSDAFNIPSCRWRRRRAAAPEGGGEGEGGIRQNYSNIQRKDPIVM